MDRPTMPGASGAGGPSGSAAAPEPRSQQPRRRKNHRAGKKKKKSRKQSFVGHDDMTQDEDPDAGLDATRESFYGLNQGGNLSGTSLDSQALLDHRDQPQYFRPRRPSVIGSSYSPFNQPQSASRLKTVHGGDSAHEDEEAAFGDEGAPLLSNSALRSDAVLASSGYGSNDRRASNSRSRRDSSRASSKRKLFSAFPSVNDSYNINYPPSMPGSPPTRPSDRDMRFEDMMMRDRLSATSPTRTEGDDGDNARPSTASKSLTSPMERRHTIALQAEEDVCFPQEGLSELADDELPVRDEANSVRGRRRRTKWPDLSMLEDWSRIEKEGRSDERRAKKITEPQLVNGRLRPIHRGWFRTEEDAPYRFTYFNEEFQSTIHSQTISELVQPGGSFRELFIPDPPLLDDSSDEGDDYDDYEDVRRPFDMGTRRMAGQQNGDSGAPTRKPSELFTHAQSWHHRGETVSPLARDGSGNSQQQSGHETPAAASRSPHGAASPPEEKPLKPPRYGERPVWWLDVLSPTEAEMKVLSKTFGIHPLTAEDIMLQEAREKVELFRHYYFVNYRTFEQDQNNEDFLEPVNMYVVVFREGVLSFHFSMTPHAANVRRRIRQLRDYLILSSDWISYALIDDITDVFGPLIQNIEDEVDEIDDAILKLHSDEEDEKGKRDSEKRSDDGAAAGSSGGDMLRRVGDCRKKVMGLYRLLGNKADVIKGFAKRCNEQWEVAPRSEIGLYLGDIQDHIVTMTSNLSHYEKILARSHANYLAQINIRMNERAEQTADVLGKLTVLGTIVLPMNIITGLWGMNVWVPGQDYEGNLAWFWCISAGLLFFGLACYLIAKRVYGIV